MRTEEPLHLPSTFIIVEQMNAHYYTALIQQLSIVFFLLAVPASLCLICSIHKQLLLMSKY